MEGLRGFYADMGMGDDAITVGRLLDNLDLNVKTPLMVALDELEEGISGLPEDGRLMVDRYLSIQRTVLMLWEQMETRARSLVPKAI